MRINLPKTFSQNDPRWKNAQLGAKGTIGAYGCLMTDATMVANYYGKDETPLTVNDKLVNNNGYSNGNLFIWSAFANLFGLRYSGQFSNSNALTKAQMDQIRGAIDSGYPVFLQIDTIPATSGLDEHWILAVDYDGDDFIVQDPWDGVTKRITSWGVKPQSLIYAWCWFEGKVPSNNQNAGNEQISIPVKERDWLVGRATTAKEVATYLEIPNPDDARTEAYTKVIGGFKSTATEANNKLGEAEKKLAVAETEIDNQKDKVANVEAKCQRELEAEKARYDALKATLPDFAKLEGQYKGTIRDLETKLKASQKEGGLKEIRITELIAENNRLIKSQAQSLSVGDIFRILLKKVL